MPARILIVDDNQANLELMLYLLRAFGHEANSCNDGLSALDLANLQPFDLVLSDILMPGIDGYEFVRRFKAVPQLRTTPLLAVTALAMVGDRERIMEAGFDGYITKPIDPQSFVFQIDAYLSEEKRSALASQHQPANARFRERRMARILIIDDTLENRLLLRTLLKYDRYDVFEAEGAADGLQMVKESHPDLVILDLNMPQMNGAAFLKSLRNDPEIKGTNVALYTGSIVDAALRDFMTLYHIAHVIPKPSEPAELLAAVRAALPA